jgi:serine/threonine protein kinase
MDTERNLLFGLLAQQAGLIDGPTLMLALRTWGANQDRRLAYILAEGGSLGPPQRQQVDNDLERLLGDHAGNAAAALAAVLGGLQQQFAGATTGDLHDAIHGLLGAATHQTVISVDSTDEHSTVDGMARGGEPYVLKDPLPSGLRYTRTALHASGGMGQVWLAHDANIGRDVALKELRAESSANKAVTLRFLREARITGQLEHPGVVPVYEISRDPETGRPLYTMRFVRGRTLTDAARTFHNHRRAGREEPLDFVNLLSAFVSVCHTIAFAHARGIIHRDLKGENIVLGDFGEVIVLDWGLAKCLEQAEADDDPDDASSDAEAVPAAAAAGQTLMGQVLGTPAYMAPEQAQGRLDLIGPCTDIFGAGAILYEVLAGRPPFAGATTVDVLQRAQQGDIVPPRTHWPDVPPTLEAICLKALSREPGDRHATAAELAREVQGWQDRQRRKAENELRRAGERLMQQQAALVKLTRSEVFAAPDLTAIYRRMIEASARTLGVERVSVWRYTEDRRAIHCHLLYELSTGRTSSGVELRAEDFPDYFAALQTSEVIAAHDARTDPRTSAFTGPYLAPLGIGAIMDAPLHVSGEMEGVVCHEHVGGAREWMPDEQLFAIAIANLVSQAISQRTRLDVTQ